MSTWQVRNKIINKPKGVLKTDATKIEAILAVPHSKSKAGLQKVKGKINSNTILQLYACLTRHKFQ